MSACNTPDNTWQTLVALFSRPDSSSPACRVAQHRPPISLICRLPSDSSVTLTRHNTSIRRASCASCVVRVVRTMRLVRVDLVPVYAALAVTHEPHAHRASDKLGSQAKQTGKHIAFAEGARTHMHAHVPTHPGRLGRPGGSGRRAAQGPRIFIRRASGTRHKAGRTRT